MEDKYCVDYDVVLSHSTSKISLGELRKINGTLNLICNKSLVDLGQLKFIKNNFWGRDSILECLGNLERVGGDLNLVDCKIKSLGRLKYVGGKLSLRDTKIDDLGELEYVGGDLHLPKKLQDIDLSNVKIKGKVRFWNNKEDSKINKILNENKWDVPNFSRIHNKELKEKSRFLTGEFLVKRCYKISQLNGFIVNNIEEFFDFVDSEIEKLYQKKYSFYHVLFHELKTTQEINNLFPIGESNEYLKKNKKNLPFITFYSKLKEYKKKYEFKGYTSKYWLRYDENKLGYSFSTGSGKRSFIYFVEDIILQIFSVFIFSLQNNFRVFKGVPKIGEGWVSETELYNLLKNHFNKEEVIQHGKPKWLGRQHVDIWFPKRKIGIEYQGLQHDQPIDFFGGEKSFIEGQKRDEKKKILFKENHSILIEVRKGYDIDKLISKIEGFK